MEVKVNRICYYGGTRHYPETSRHRTAGQPFVLKDVKDFSDQFMIIVDATPGEKKAAFANLKAKEDARELGIKKRRERTGRITHGEPVPSMVPPPAPKEKTNPVPEPGDPGYDDKPAAKAPEAPPAGSLPPEDPAPAAPAKSEKSKRPVGRPPKK